MHRGREMTARRRRMKPASCGDGLRPGAEAIGYDVTMARRNRKAASGRSSAVEAGDAQYWIRWGSNAVILIASPMFWNYQ